MKHLCIYLVPILLQSTMTLFEFNPKSNIQNWRIVDDVVMGGRSNGNFKLNDLGYGEFYGDVSIENNGGFSMVQHTFEGKNITPFQKVSIKLKGDGKTYQFRVKTSNSDYYSYVYAFKTTGDWQTINIPFEQLQPAFRGRKLNKENFPGNQIEMIAFLIGNKKAENFKLQISHIILES